MGVKIFSRNQIIVNLALFIALSFFYHHVIVSIGQGVSALDLGLIYSKLKGVPIMMGLAVLLMFQVVKASPASRYIFPLFVIYVTYKNLGAFFINFDKVVLTLSFLYIVIAFYLYILWVLEMNSAAYRPRYKSNDIDQRSLLNLDVTVEDEGENKYLGLLTNWDLDSCFVLLDCEQVVGNVRGNVCVRAKFDDTEFVQHGKVVSGYGFGVGIRFIHEESSPFTPDWHNFYSILSDRGYILQR